MSSIVFKHLEIEGWRQFEDVDIDFHPRLTIITGTNGSGKSTLLSICSRHFGWSKVYLSTPIKDDQGRTSYVPGLLSRVWHKLRTKREPANQTPIGSLTYSDGKITLITMPLGNQAQYGLTLTSQLNVQGVHIDSYRPAPNYSAIQNIPITSITPDQAYSNYNHEVLTKTKAAILSGLLYTD